LDRFKKEGEWLLSLASNQTCTGATTLAATYLAGASSSGFRAVAIETLSRQIAASAAEYVDKIALRSHSDLECLDDAAFHDGLDALREHGSAHPDFPKLAGNDVFTLEKV
jgi:hypothetical protein